MKLHTASFAGLLGLAVSALAQTQGPSGLAVTSFLDQQAAQTSGTSTTPTTLWLQLRQRAETGVLHTGDVPDSITFGPVHGKPVNVPIGVGTTSASGSDYFSRTWVGGGPVLSSDIGVFGLDGSKGQLSLTAVWKGGNYNDFSTTVIADPLNLPAQPFFSADTFAAFSSGSILGTSSYQLQFSAFAPLGGALSPQRKIEFLDANNKPFEAASLNATSTTYTFATGKLKRGDWLTVELSDSYVVGGQTYLATTSMTFTSIPEPSTYAALVGAGALALAVIVRRRRR